MRTRRELRAFKRPKKIKITEALTTGLTPSIQDNPVVEPYQWRDSMPGKKPGQAKIVDNRSRRLQRATRPGAVTWL
jgi:hypothetical protein